jgi:hypothetical protein
VRREVGVLGERKGKLHRNLFLTIAYNRCKNGKKKKKKGTEGLHERAKTTTKT